MLVGSYSLELLTAVDTTPLPERAGHSRCADDRSEAGPANFAARKGVPGDYT